MSISHTDSFVQFSGFKLSLGHSYVIPDVLAFSQDHKLITSLSQENKLCCHEIKKKQTAISLIIMGFFPNIRNYTKF